MLEKAGCKNINPYNNGRVPGNDIHEMGGIRMGKDPKTSLLNKWNQLHHCSNVFVTDGASMTSVGNAKSVFNIYGHNSQSSEPCGGRVEERKPVNEESKMKNIKYKI